MTEDLNKDNNIGRYANWLSRYPDKVLILRSSRRRPKVEKRPLKKHLFILVRRFVNQVKPTQIGVVEDDQVK